MKVSCSTRVPMILGAITSAKSTSLVFTSSWSLTDPAAWTIPRTGLPPSRMWSLSQAVTCSPSATSTLAVVIWTPRRSIARIVVTVAKWGSSSVSRRPTASRRDGASAQQRDVPCSTFGQVGGHDAAERSCSAGDDIGRIRGELGGERSSSGRCTGAGAGRMSFGRGSRSDLRRRRREGARRCARRFRASVRSASSMSMRPPQCSENSW